MLPQRIYICPVLRAAALNAPPHTVLLANGDETHGTIGSITPELVQLDSEVGAMELPASRLTAIDFGGPPVERRAGARLRLANGGILTLKNYRIENRTMVGESELAGELKLPLEAVQELVFAAPKEAESKPAH